MGVFPLGSPGPGLLRFGHNKNEQAEKQAMATGFRATFVISWSQTEVDGLRAASPDMLTVGAAWRWTGGAVRVDAPGDPLILEGAEGGTEMRRRAARMVQRLIGIAMEDGAEPALAEPPGDLPEQSFVLTDGRQTHIATVLPVQGSGARLVMFVDAMPPEGVDLWVVRARLQPTPRSAAQGGVICFTPGTMIQTADGAQPVEGLRPGDLVQTADDGLQPILWTGSRRMSGARLYTMPELRPVRLRAGALGAGRPDRELLVSPRHRILLRGAAARALFNADEVLVAAEDLVNDRSVLVDHSLREVTYHHLMLDRHQIVFANGIEAESFHPAAMALEMIEAADRSRLLQAMPGLARDPASYGDHARRCLSASEAAILCHARLA